MLNRRDGIRIEIHVERRSVRRALVVGGTLILFAAAGVSFAVPVTFSDGDVLTAKQLNDNFEDLERQVAAVGGGNTAGNRLKGKFYLGADGAKQYKPGIWYDSELEIDCEFKLASDGKTRCLPIVSSSVIRYQDKECTKPLVRYDRVTPPLGCPFSPTPEYIIVYEEFPTGCPNPVSEYPPARVYLLGAASGAPATYLVAASGDCQGNSGLGTSTWQLGEEVPASSFVEITEEVDP